MVRMPRNLYASIAYTISRDRFPGDHETERKGPERVNLKASSHRARLLGDPWKLLCRIVAEMQLEIGSRLGMNVDSRNLRERLTETKL